MSLSHRIMKAEVIKMLEMIYTIPENVGWAIVGAMSALTVVMVVAVVKTIYLAIRYRVEDEFNV